MLRARLAIVALLFPSAAVAQERFAVEAADSRKVEARISYEIVTERMAVDRWMVFLPKPPELPGQVGVKASAWPDGKVTAEKSPLARPVFLVDRRPTAPAGKRRIEVQLKVEATLRSRKLVPLAAGDPPPKVAPLREAERKFSLAPSSVADFEAAPFRDWLEARKLKRRPGEADLALAERVLEAERAQFEYGFDASEEKRASAACGRRKTDCGGMAFVFVAAMRANGVPARPLVGRLAEPRAPGSKPGDLEHDRPHVRVEFFVPDLGWVPVDPNAVQADRTRGVRSFLGNDPGDLLVLHADVDFQLPFRDKVERAGFLQVSPYYWAYGTGTFDGKFGPTGWELKSTPLGE